MKMKPMMDAENPAEDQMTGEEVEPQPKKMKLAEIFSKKAAPLKAGLKLKKTKKVMRVAKAFKAKKFKNYSYNG